MTLEPITKSKQHDPFEAFIGCSDTILSLIDTVREVARTDSTVLITGEGGTGKGLMARTIHAASDRSGKPFVTANCVVHSRALLHSELFGEDRDQGSSDGGVKRGRFELASGGTLFLDEIGDIFPETQMLLLRILEERTFERVGGGTTLAADVRLIAAANRDLQLDIAEGAFRSELYYRLNVIPVRMPPLRERRDDVPLLANHFLARYVGRHGKPVDTIDPAAMELMTAYSWPGNVRELETVVERSVVLSRSKEIVPDDLPQALQQPGRGPAIPGRGTLLEIEAVRITEALSEAEGNKKLAARKLGIHRSTLYKKIEKLGLNR
ncbi:MAG: sigma-54-dependent Fis family transcriptional regulator [Acidobacteria bacterium]|uniref:Sigma-54-dependent Fis family transcriptional regulator n=1 Tax=Candidatus Polarisedimenticola svalbardensis TaxID=2886004 RepID=A0A8J6Y7J0_9BACT|nr:sigma-54-dependent Fis family transcriptional regulator [Candidatus Polarisedimenticola svalbardensis]